MQAKKIEVVAYDAMSSLPGRAAILHSWKTAHHHGKRKMAKLQRRANRWLRKAVTQDRSNEHVIYLRGV